MARDVSLDVDVRVKVDDERKVTVRIGELARRAGVSQRALRYYEEQGLLRPGRRLSGYREYSDADVHTVRDIRTLLAAGLGTATIAEVLPCMVTDGGQLVTPCGDLVELLARERDRIDSAVRELMAAREMLDAIVVASGSSRLATAAACEEGEVADNSRRVASPHA
jgi:DNA-binding transcriptional MerR regulator